MLAPGKIFINTVLRLTAAFVDGNGAAVDPAKVTLRTKSPGNVEAAYVYGADAELQRPAVGSYTADITPSEAGRWRFRWETTGTGTTLADEGDFIVQHSAFFDDIEDYA